MGPTPGPGGLSRDSRGRFTGDHEAGAHCTTVGQRWKARRDWVICVCARAGISQRLLADVFDLPHSRIAAIVKKHRDRQIGGPARGPAQ